ncbi:MAG TPA: histidinol-phosphate transaminase [Sandaracinaceae bacterium LLY-WYZ-13_1]|nr:histidinol-phosphate transaminase [Sandaracinaceae bacterium LLY-WYZ-13_1]
MSLVPENVERLVPYVPGKPVEELQRELGIGDAVKLASNENPMGPAPAAVEAMRAHANEVHRYPDAAAYALRRDLAAHHDVEMDEIVMGNGSNELIDLICRTYAGPQDHGVIGVPSFVCYHLGLTAANVPFDAVPLRDHLYWDLDAMLEKVRPETKLFFVANPNNPTGTHVGREALVKLLKELPEQVVAVLDEAYVQFADADDYLSALELRDLRERLIVLRTFSKAYGLAANRVGYAIGPTEIVSYLHRVRAPFNVGTLGQVAARAALTDQAYVDRYVAMNAEQRARLTEELTGLGFTVAPSQANFVFVDFGRPNREVYDRLLRQGVIVRPMPAPVGTWIRITVGLPEENDRLLAAVRELDQAP